jgi:hypothetical protein
MPKFTVVALAGSAIKRIAPYALPGLLTYLTAGCAISLPPGELETITTPAVGALATREVGESLLEYKVGRTYAGIHFPYPQILPYVGTTFTVSGDWAASSREEIVYCGTAKQMIVAINIGGGPVDLPPRQICVSRATLDKAGTKYTRGKVVLADGTSFKQELVYQGRSGSTVRVAYREFSGDLIRPAFAQDLSFDMAQGKVIGFRGVRVEVEKADNTSISYRVLNSFVER